MRHDVSRKGGKGPTMLDMNNPMFDAIETIKGTDVISSDKKLGMFQALERFRRSHCPPHGNCLPCAMRRRCLATIADLLGS